MKMKKLLFVVTALVMSIGLVACGSNKDNNSTTPEIVEQPSAEETVIEEPATEPVTEEPAKETPVTEADLPESEDQVSSGEDNFEVEMDKVLAFAAKIKEAVAAEDMEKLSELVAFPTYVGFMEEGIVVETKEDFLLLDKGKVFTPEMLASIKEADETLLSPSMAGFTLAKEYAEKVPSITFGIVNGNLGISGINY